MTNKNKWIGTPRAILPINHIEKVYIADPTVFSTIYKVYATVKSTVVSDTGTWRDLLIAEFETQQEAQDYLVTIASQMSIGGLKYD